MKNCIKTHDVFVIKDARKRMNYFDFCRKKALNSGLICRCHIDGMNTALFMEGSKWQFVKYYIATLSKARYVDSIKRLISVIFA